MSEAADTQMYGNDAKTTETFWQKIEAGVAEFVAGTEVKIEEDTKGAALTFTAKNEFGTAYNFTVNGKISLTGKPQA